MNSKNTSLRIFTVEQLNTNPTRWIHVDTKRRSGSTIFRCGEYGHVLRDSAGTLSSRLIVILSSMERWGGECSTICRCEECHRGFHSGYRSMGIGVVSFVLWVGVFAWVLLSSQVEAETEAGLTEFCVLQICLYSYLPQIQQVTPSKILLNKVNFVWSRQKNTTGIEIWLWQGLIPI